LLLQVGCFFMGIVGVVCKAHIARYSELFSLGLATGLMGSITTYSSWNQDMAALFVAGMWAKGIFGIIVGGTSAPFSVPFQDTRRSLNEVWMHHAERQDLPFVDLESSKCC
jgi:hypothetical protein